MGRLVWNHSTHIEGLIPLLRKLAEHASVTTVTPARIKPTKGNGRLQVRVTVPICGGWKLQARKGRLAQEVFVVTTLGKSELQTILNEETK